jgi:hypothetical protein
MTDEQLIIILSKERIELQEELRKQTELLGEYSKWWLDANRKLDEANIKIQELTDKLNAQ